jgi:hypothetical protein
LWQEEVVMEMVKVMAKEEVGVRLLVVRVVVVVTGLVEGVMVKIEPALLARQLLHCQQEPATVFGVKHHFST